MSDSLWPPWTSASQASLSFTISGFAQIMSIESLMLSSHLILCCPLLLPSIFLSISCANEYSGLASFRADWFDLLAVQGTLKSLLQNHSSKTSILWSSVFFYCPALTSVGFNLWVGKSPGRREWLSAPVLWLGEFHGLSTPRGHKESDTTEWLSPLHLYMTTEKKNIALTIWTL